MSNMEREGTPVSCVTADLPSIPPLTLMLASGPALFIHMASNTALAMTHIHSLYRMKPEHFTPITISHR